MIRFALHGGAGDPPPGPRDERGHRAVLSAVGQRALDALRHGATALDVVEEAVAAMEDCPLFNAGVGAVLNHEGRAEMDAAIMDGDDRRCGAVAAVQRARSPVRLARAVMERSPHLLLVAEGAERFGRSLGLSEVAPEFFVTEERRAQLAEARRLGVIALDHQSHAGDQATDTAAFGTVGAVARDARGQLAAATSTGGLTNKLPGRVGDSPIPGAGTYADARSLAISCTGTGEAFLRACFGHQIHARLLWGGQTLDAALASGLADLERLGGRGGCIAIDHEGHIALPFNSRLMYRAWVEADGVLRVAVESGDAET